MVFDGSAFRWPNGSSEEDFLGVECSPHWSDSEPGSELPEGSDSEEAAAAVVSDEDPLEEAEPTFISGLATLLQHVSIPNRFHEQLARLAQARDDGQLGAEEQFELLLEQAFTAPDAHLS